MTTFDLPFRPIRGSLSTAPLGTMMQSLHDNSITNSIRTFLAGKLCVAVMGGHKIARNHDTYRAVATLARQLARAGFTLASGGGPVAEIEKAVTSFSGSESPLDDQTLMVVQWCGGWAPQCSHPRRG